MARSDGSIIIDTRVDADGFGRGVKSMKSQIGGLTSAVKRLGAAIGLAFGVKALVDFGKSAIDLGSDLQEVQNVVDVTFSTMNEAVNEFAKNAAETAGLSETMAKRYTGTFGAMAKAFGFAEGQAFDMATSLTQLSGDVASFYNLTQDEAYTKLKSVFTGETESLKDLGVVMTQTALDSFAMAEGYGKTTKQMSEQEKVALRYAFVLDQLSNAQGDFVRTSDSWANQTKILSLNFDSFKANIGQALINIFTPFLKVLNQIVDKMAQLSQRFVAFSEMLVGKSTSGGGGSPGQAVEEIAQGFDNVTEATKEAEKAQKKYLSGLDELRTFTDNSDVISQNGLIGGVESVTNTVNNDNSSLEKNSSLLDVLKAKVQELADKFTIFNNVVETVKGTFELFFSVAEDLVSLLIRPITDNKDGILEAAKNIATFTLGIVERITEGFKRFVDELNRVYDERISLVIENIKNDISNFIKQFLDWFNNDISPILNKWGEKFDEVWTEHVDPLFTNLAEFFGKVVEGIGTLWDETIKPFVEWIGEKLGAFLPPLIEGFGDAFLNAFEKIIEIAGFLLGALEGVIDFIVGVFTGDWEQAWEGLVTAFENIVSAITSFFEGLFGFIFESIESVANGIGGLFDNNKGGGIFVPQIPSVPVPHLATGAVIPPNAPFMAMLGDQRHGTNIEAPLDTIKQAVREVVGNGSNGGQYSFSAQINRRILFEEFIEEAKLQKSMTGHNPLDF